MERSVVFVCHGRSCRHHKGYDQLRDRLDAVAEVTKVRCQRICNGPVVGLEIDSSIEWFERVRSEKVQRRLVDFVAGRGRMRRSLAKRRVAKRGGRLR
jgi:hypothetical protein